MKTLIPIFSIVIILGAFLGYWFGTNQNSPTKEFNNFQISNKESLPTGELSTSYIQYDLDLSVDLTVVGVNLNWTLSNSNCGDLLTLTSRGHFMLQTGLSANSTANYYHFNIQVEASKKGYKNRSISENFSFGVAQNDFSDFVITTNAPSGLIYGYGQQEWTASINASPTPETITWELAEVNTNLNSKLSIATNGKITLQTNLDAGSYTYKIKATAHSVNYADKTVTTGQLTLTIGNGTLGDFTIDPKTPSGIVYGYTQQTWTPTTSSISQLPTIVWELVDFNEFGNKLSINSSSGQITLATGLSGGDYHYKIMATASKANYSSKTVTTGQLTLTIKYTAIWTDIFDSSKFIDSDFDIQGTGQQWGNFNRNRIWYNESLGLIKVNFINLYPKITSAQPLVLFKWLKSDYNAKSIFSQSLMAGGTDPQRGRSDLTCSIDDTDALTQSLLMGPSFTTLNQMICGYVILNLKNNDPSLDWTDQTITAPSASIDNPTNITCKYNSDAGLIHLQASALTVTSDMTSDQGIFSLGSTIPIFSSTWQNAAVTKITQTQQIIKVNILWNTIINNDRQISTGWTSDLTAWTTGASYSFDFYFCTQT